MSSNTRAPAQGVEQAPLGPQPSYDDVLDAAVEYTFPCSDPIAVDACCDKILKKKKQQRETVGETPSLPPG